MPDASQTHPKEKEIFLAASEFEAGAERDAFLDESCGEDVGLRNRIDALLEAEAIPTNIKAKPWVRDIVKQLHETSSFAKKSKIQHTGHALWEPPTPEKLDSLLKRYDVETLLGRGGMGAVYRGVQTALERPVAIKILPPEFGEDPNFAERFRREALAMAKLDHPNIVTIFDFGSVTTTDKNEGESAPREIFYFVMEFVDGTDLHQLIRSGKLAAENALEIVGQICEALQYAHGHGYVHRDIKPANIFVTGNGVIKVGDFGLAKLTGTENTADDEHLTVTGYVVGTPAYLAPENLEAKGKLDHRADIYSLGVIFYEMLTGSLPKGAFPLPSEKSGSDARLDEVVVKALQSEPDRRYQQASEVKIDVDHISGTRIPVAPPAKASQPRASGGSKSGKRFGAILAAMAIALAGILSFAFWDRPDPAPPQGDPPSPSVPRTNATAAITFPLPVPTSDLPDTAKLPTGKIHVWGKTEFDNEMSLGKWGNISDFVEVQLDSGGGWFGLRANGDVLRWNQHNDQSTVHRIGQKIATLGRGSESNIGAWLSADGSFVNRTHSEDFGKRAPATGIVDLARTKNAPEIYTILMESGEIQYFGSGTPPPKIDDVVRIEAWRDTVFGIRQSGDLVHWGEAPPADLDLAGRKFAKLVSSTVQMIGLTTDGEVWSSTHPMPSQSADPRAVGPFIDVTCGWKICAARRADGYWVAWGIDEFAETIEKINSLGPDVFSLAINTHQIAWLESRKRAVNKFSSEPIQGF